MSLPINPSDGAIGYLNGITYQFDAYAQKWVITKTNIDVSELSDVSSVSPENNSVLLWDSDNQVWTPASIQQSLGATGQKINSFIAAQDQTQFFLSNSPIGDVILIKNGVQLDPSYYSVSGKTVIYTSNIPIKSGDVVQFIYNNGSNVGFSAELNDLTDVSYTANTLEQNDVLGWDSETQSFKSFNLQQQNKILENRVTELEGEIAQAVADRIFTDGLLQTQITNNDSDIAASGRFFVQATPPTGGPNSGWVNTTNMKLYVWDTDESIWVQTNIG